MLVHTFPTSLPNSTKLKTFLYHSSKIEGSNYFTLFLDERYMCFSMKIEKHMRTLSDQKCSQWTHETMGKYRVKALLVSRWVPKFPGVQINKWMKQDFVNLVKKWWNILQDFPGQWAILSECNQYNLAISFL